MKRLCLLLAATFLSATPRAQNVVPGNPSQVIGAVSGTGYYFSGSDLSGTVGLVYSFTGTPSSVSILVQWCGQDMTTCTTPAPISGANPYVTSSNGMQQYIGGYAYLLVTPTFSGATLNIYKVGIQAKTVLPTGGAPTNNPSGGANNYAPLTQPCFSTDSSATPGLVCTVTSTNAAGTLTGTYALSTSGISSGYSCVVNRAYAGSSTMTGEARCTSAAGATTLSFTSPASAKGSEVWTLVLSSNSTSTTTPYSYSAAKYATATNCSSAASPAVCGSAAAGSAALPAGTTTIVVNDTAVTVNSIIAITGDASLGTKLGVTCNTNPELLTASARTAGTSFTVTGASPTTNPACFGFTITN